VEKLQISGNTLRNVCFSSCWKSTDTEAQLIAIIVSSFSYEFAVKNLYLLIGKIESGMPLSNTCPLAAVAPGAL
jgi:hypothetical protein